MVSMHFTQGSGLVAILEERAIECVLLATAVACVMRKSWADSVNLSFQLRRALWL